MNNELVVELEPKEEDEMSTPITRNGEDLRVRASAYREGDANKRVYQTDLGWLVAAEPSNDEAFENLPVFATAEEALNYRALIAATGDYPL